MTRSEAERLLAVARWAELTGPGAGVWAERLEPKRKALRKAVNWLAANGDADRARLAT